MAETDKKPSAKSLSRAVKDVQKPKKPVTNDDDADSGGDPQDGSKDGKTLQTVDPRQFVKINPPLDTEKTAVSESRSTTKIDYLIRNGLGDQNHLSYYRQAIADPRKAITNPNLRKYVAEVLEEVLDLMFNDAQTYNRIRTLLQKNGKHLEEVEKDPLESPGGVGTDEVTKKYAGMTPGQSFELIKKALKGIKNDR